MAQKNEIVDSRAKVIQPYGDLEIGSIYEFGGRFYIKASSPYDDKLDFGVNLSDGSTDFMDLLTPVVSAVAQIQIVR